LGEVGRKFLDLATRLANFQTPSLPLAAFAPNWRQEIARMRWRIEKERTPAGKTALSIKTAAGGLMDAEFIAQTLCLEHGLSEPNTLRALEAVRAAKFIGDTEGISLIENFRKLRRVEITLRRWSYEGETELPDDPAPYYRVSVRCGFPTPEDFRAAVASYRAAIRAVYARVFANELAELDAKTPTKKPWTS